MLTAPDGARYVAKAIYEILGDPDFDREQADARFLLESSIYGMLLL